MQSGDLITPLMQLDEGGVQALMDNIWSLGFRPTEAAPTEGCLKAMEDHINSLKGVVDVCVRPGLVVPQETDDGRDGPSEN